MLMASPLGLPPSRARLQGVPGTVNTIDQTRLLRSSVSQQLTSSGQPNAERWSNHRRRRPSGLAGPAAGGLAAQPDAKDRGHSAASSSWWACSDTPGGRDGGGGRWPYPLPCARQRFTFCPATRRSSLSLAVGVRVASTWVDPPRRWREGQVHDGWNREMVQRRQGLWLHRPRVRRRRLRTFQRDPGGWLPLAR